MLLTIVKLSNYYYKAKKLVFVSVILNTFGAKFLKIMTAVSPAQLKWVYDEIPSSTE